MPACGDADAAWGSTEQIRLEKENKTKQNKTKQNKTNKRIEKKKKEKGYCGHFILLDYQERLFCQTV
jgi:hypothetical protein